MDAKYNWLIDNMTVRLTMVAVAFAAWLAASAALLTLAKF